MIHVIINMLKPIQSENLLLNTCTWVYWKTIWRIFRASKYFSSNE